MDDQNRFITERLTPLPGTKILTGNSEANSGLDYCAEFLTHVACAKTALVQLQERCFADRNIDDKEKARAYKDREGYRLMIQHSVSALLDEVGRLGPCPDHDLHLWAAETVQTGQPQCQEKTTLSASQSPPLTPHDLRQRLASETRLYTCQHESSAEPTQRTIPSFLEILPAELRQQIYRELLHSPRSIHGGELVEEKATALIIPDTVQAYQILAIDATILRTCRKVYQEALPILYQVNQFGFQDVRSLWAFRSGGLTLVASPANMASRVPVFGLSPNQNGRLSNIRNLSLGFNRKPGSSAAFESLMYKMHLAQDSRTYGYSEWAELLHGNKCTSPIDHISFPFLETLLLDFSEWNMNTNEGLVTRPFIGMFRSEKPLKSLTVVGVKHAASTERLKEELVGSLGEFRAVPRAISEADFWDNERPWKSRASWGS